MGEFISNRGDEMRAQFLDCPKLPPSTGDALAVAGICWDEPSGAPHHFERGGVGYVVTGRIAVRGHEIIVTPRMGITEPQEARLRGAAEQAFLQEPCAGDGWAFDGRAGTWLCWIADANPGVRAAASGACVADRALGQA